MHIFDREEVMDCGDTFEDDILHVGSPNYVIRENLRQVLQLSCVHYVYVIVKDLFNRDDVLCRQRALTHR
jgi:hypothetical protein